MVTVVTVLIPRAAGFAYNGGAFYSCYGGAAYGTCSSWSNDAVQFEGNTFDCTGGHASGASANYAYHYHVPPTHLIDQLGQTAAAQATTTSHSPQVGWAYDGFPIYGPNGPGGIMMQKCGNTGADASTCLDECNGLEREIATVDQFK